MNTRQQPHFAPVETPLVMFGIGNCGRNDDGLGWAFLDQINKDGAFPGQLEYRYQLQIEDAALIRDAGQVVFVDSCQGILPGGFSWEPCEASPEFEFTSHVLAPQAVLFLCQDLYGKKPAADLLKIQGVAWELKNGMSAQAHKHLESALRFFRNKSFGNPQKIRRALD